jgi:hypothetical protein
MDETETYYDMGVYNLAKLVRDMEAPIDAVLTALYRLVRTEPELERWAIVNAGCSVADIVVAEERIGHALAPIHRHLLLLSNGGTLPFMPSISWLAAAALREREWRIVGPFVRPDETTPVINIRQRQPISPRVLGDPADNVFAGDDLLGIVTDDFVPFGGGFGGEVWGYVRGEPNRIDCILPPLFRHREAENFVEFLLWQELYDGCGSPRFHQRLRAALTSDEPPNQ